MLRRKNEQFADTNPQAVSLPDGREVVFDGIPSDDEILRYLQENPLEQDNSYDDAAEPSREQYKTRQQLALEEKAERNGIDLPEWLQLASGPDLSDMENIDPVMQRRTEAALKNLFSGCAWLDINHPKFQEYLPDADRFPMDIELEVENFSVGGFLARQRQINMGLGLDTYSGYHLKTVRGARIELATRFDASNRVIESHNLYLIKNYKQLLELLDDPELSHQIREPERRQIMPSQDRDSVQSDLGSLGKLYDESVKVHGMVGGPQYYSVSPGGLMGSIEQMALHEVRRFLHGDSLVADQEDVVNTFLGTQNPFRPTRRSDQFEYGYDEPQSPTETQQSRRTSPTTPVHNPGTASASRDNGSIPGKPARNVRPGQSHLKANKVDLSKDPVESPGGQGVVYGGVDSAPGSAQALPYPEHATNLVRSPDDSRLGKYMSEGFSVIDFWKNRSGRQKRWIIGATGACAVAVYLGACSGVSTGPTGKPITPKNAKVVATQLSTALAKGALPEHVYDSTGQAYLETNVNDGWLPEGTPDTVDPALKPYVSRYTISANSTDPNGKVTDGKWKISTAIKNGSFTVTPSKDSKKEIITVNPVLLPAISSDMFFNINTKTGSSSVQSNINKPTANQINALSNYINQHNQKLYGSYGIKDIATAETQLKGIKTKQFYALGELAVLENIDKQYGDGLDKSFQSDVKNYINTIAKKQNISTSDIEIKFAKGDRASAVDSFESAQSKQVLGLDRSGAPTVGSMYRLAGINDIKVSEEKK